MTKHRESVCRCAWHKSGKFLGWEANLHLSFLTAKAKRGIWPVMRPTVCIRESSWFSQKKIWVVFLFFVFSWAKTNQNHPLSALKLFGRATTWSTSLFRRELSLLYSLVRPLTEVTSSVSKPEATSDRLSDPEGQNCVGRGMSMVSSRPSGPSRASVTLQVLSPRLERKGIWERSWNPHPLFVSLPLIYSSLFEVRLKWEVWFGWRCLSKRGKPGEKGGGSWFCQTIKRWFWL